MWCLSGPALSIYVRGLKDGKRNGSMMQKTRFGWMRPDVFHKSPCRSRSFYCVPSQGGVQRNPDASGTSTPSSLPSFHTHWHQWDRPDAGSCVMLPTFSKTVNFLLPIFLLQTVNRWSLFEGPSLLFLLPFLADSRCWSQILVVLINTLCFSNIFPHWTVGNLRAETLTCSLLITCNWYKSCFMAVQ